MSADGAVQAAIRQLTTPDEALPFVRKLLDGGFQAPMLETPEQLKCNLLACFAHPQDCVLGVEQEGTLMGVFSMMTEPQERYLEMMLALSEDEAACGLALSYLRQQFPGYTLDCVIHPACTAMRRAFAAMGGKWEPVQQKFRLPKPEAAAPVFHSSASIPEGCHIHPCDAATRDAYIAMHTTDCYWTAQRVLEAPERFAAYVAVEKNQVVGYLDVTRGFAENEVYDWQVQEASRNRGIGTNLLGKAIRQNGSGSMVMLLSQEEKAACRAAEKNGFRVVAGAESITGTLVL